MENNIHRGISRVLSIILVFMAMMAIGVGIYFVSSRVSQQQAIAPTAPVSEPEAKTKEERKEAIKKGDPCKGKCGNNETCSGGTCKKKADPPATLEDYKCDSTKCPGPCFSCNASKTSCIAHPDATGCGGVSRSVASDVNNCGGTGIVCGGNLVCSNGACRETTTGPSVTPVPNATPTLAPTTTQTIPPQSSKDPTCMKNCASEPTSNQLDCINRCPVTTNNCRGECATIDCHCQQGDVCTPGAGICNEPVPGTSLTVRQACAQQGRSWCVNQHGTGMTCCAPGYSCHPTDNGCAPSESRVTGGGGGGGTTTTTTTTEAPTPTPTPIAACISTTLFIGHETTASCTADADCSGMNLPEGQYCKQSTGKCNGWQPATASEIASNARVGDKIKVAFAAANTTSVEVKVNQASFQPATKNTSTNKWDYVFTLSNAGSFDIQARYVIP